MKLNFIVAALCLLASATGFAGSPVETHGHLKVEGTALADEHGNPVQLKGVSMGWHCLWPRFYNQSTVERLAKDWGAQVVRCAVGVDLTDISLDKRPSLAYAAVDSIVAGAVANGIYAIIDFHSHANNLALAKDFFGKVTRKYGHLPNLIYEIWNEPTEVEWAETKAYAEELLPIIRKNAPHAVVIVPTPRWDQDVDKAAADPIKTDKNIMYSIHYYAATHTGWLRDRAQAAVDKGLPLFMAECAAMEHTGDGPIDPESWKEWMKLADKNNISWVAWSVSDKFETCSMLHPTASSFGMEWKDSDLKPWARLVKESLKR